MRRVDEHGDELFWSFNRMYDGFCLWLFFAVEGRLRRSLWVFLVYHRRPYIGDLHKRF